MDLCVCNNKNYVVICNYHSNYPEVCPLKKTRTAVIKAMKFIFAGQGFPKIIISDNGPQFTSEEFLKLGENYNFQHKTSSPKPQQSNGLGGKTISIINNLLKNSGEDFYLSLLAYRATPLSCGK
ncbi:uncharacterized protein K02A2.6-like [Saccostrea cucullata]|uniref:uncharacterized protein K02A2.6-like n=1 Tax=Saccostrea cuccullata TaxID=36930 RepID=UPI002ED10DC3